MTNKIQIKAKILDMVYYQEEHVFMMEILNLHKGEKVKLVIKAFDFGIPKNTSIDIINNFCEMMKNKEKNLFIGVEGKKMEDLKKEKEKEISEEELYELHAGFDNFPYEELEKILRKEQQQKNES